MKRLGQLLSVITWLLVAGSVIIIGGGLFGRPLLLAAVPTGSMVPVLNPGDLIVVLPTWAVHQPGLGDIVVYKTEKDQDWIVHRIVDGNTAEGFVTKGDANSQADPHRVFPRDIAGAVPQWSGSALRLPRLGLLSIGDGALSSPVVAGAALIMGIYLMVLDVKPSGRRRLSRLGRTRAGPEAALSLYLGLAATAFLTTLIPGWTLSSRQLLVYETVAQRPANVVQAGTYLLGEIHREDVVIANPSPLPLVVVFNTDDPHVTYDPWWAVIPGNSKHAFKASVENPDLGEHKAGLTMGVYLPLLPPALLASLARWNMPLGALLVAVVPAALILALALVDIRTRMALGRLRTRVAAKFTV